MHSIALCKAFVTVCSDLNSEMSHFDKTHVIIYALFVFLANKYGPPSSVNVCTVCVTNGISFFLYTCSYKFLHFLQLVRSKTSKLEVVQRLHKVQYMYTTLCCVRYIMYSIYRVHVM